MDDVWGGWRVSCQLRVYIIPLGTCLVHDVGCLMLCIRWRYAVEGFPAAIYHI